MKPELSEQNIIFSASLFIALILHISIVIAVIYLPSISQEKARKTIPVVLIAAGSKASNASQPTKNTAENSAAANAFLSTLETSTFETAIESPHSNNHLSTGKTNTPSQNLLTTPDLPQISSTKQLKTTSAKRARQGMLDLFKQQTPEQVKQVSTKNYEHLSDYELSLRSMLSRAVLYDHYHKFIAAKGKDSVNFEITLSLFQNGAIKKAIVSRSSGIAEIDRLAQMTAYDVSPYPRPPKEDEQTGFKYSISITYQPPTQ